MGFLDFLPLIGKGVEAIGNLFSTSSTNENQMEIAKYNWDQQIKMWERNNEYNTPLNQMKRLQAAGLNPNLIYGSSGNTGNASFSGSPQMPNLHRFQMPDLGQTMYQIQALQSQRKLNDANANKADSESALNALKQTYQTIVNNRESFDYEFKKEMKQVMQDTLRAQMKLAQYNSDIAYEKSMQEVNNTTLSDTTLNSRISRELATTANAWKTGKNIEVSTTNLLASAGVSLATAEKIGKEIRKLQYEWEAKPTHEDMSFATYIKQVGIPKVEYYLKDAMLTKLHNGLYEEDDSGELGIISSVLSSLFKIL